MKYYILIGSNTNDVLCAKGEYYWFQEQRTALEKNWREKSEGVFNEEHLSMTKNV